MERDFVDTQYSSLEEWLKLNLDSSNNSRKLNFQFLNGHHLSDYIETIHNRTEEVKALLRLFLIQSSNLVSDSIALTHHYEISVIDDFKNFKGYTFT